MTFYDTYANIAFIMKETPTELDSFPEADALIDVAVSEDDAQQTSDKISEAFRQYQNGEITGGEYAEISQRLGYREQLAKDAAAAAIERVNNHGQPPTRAQRLLARFGLRQK